MKTSYDEAYQNPNHFNHQRWLFVPYVRALITKLNVLKGSRMLDIGCGTGFFSKIFYEEGVNVVGIDFSKVGVRAARKLCKGKVNFIAGDANRIPLKENSFDLIFCRSLSLYNKEGFRRETALTDNLLKMLKRGGYFIFSHTTDGSGKLNESG